MKKWLFSALFALALMVCVTPAQAAVVSGGVEYVWYTGEEGLCISCDRGGSYAVLPELETAKERTGLAYAIVVEPNANNDGGLSVKGRDTWSTEYTWFQEYSVQEIAAALKNPTKVTPVRVHATNGTVTVGSRHVKDYGNDDLSRHLSAGNLLDGEYAGDRIVYSTDGVTWFPAEGECALNWLGSIWWDGSAFRGSDGHLSEDGIHWTWTEENWFDPSFFSLCELGPYRFEYAENAAGERGVYLMDQTDPESGVLLPHMGEEARARGVSIGKLRAWYGPDDTVILAAYDVYGKENHMVVIDYPISSLDWCLENLKAQFRLVEAQVSNGTVSLGMVERRRVAGAGNDREMVYNDGSGWKWVENIPWGSSVYLEPYSGKTFVATSAPHIYASEDGLSWQEVEALYAGPGDYTNCDLAWTGKEYIARRHTGTSRSGMFGMSGGNWQEGFSEVYFLNEDFQIISTYDFDRLVQSVGYLDEAYYAKVANSTGTRDGWGEDSFSSGLGSTLYRSADGKTWTALGEEYLDIEDILVGQWGGEKKGNLPTGDSAKPLRTVAQLDRWRFILYERYPGYFDVHLLRDNANDMTYLDMEEGMKSRWITPGSLTAAYTPDGKVEVTVTDLSTPSMEYSVTYTPEELDNWKTGDYHLYYRGLGGVDERRGDGIDVGLLKLMNGEKELCYRDGTTGGKYMYLDSVPWSNSIELLPYSGKDFMVLDKVDGKVYLSADGKTWREATGDWIVSQRDHDYWQYAFVWTGDHYLGICQLAEDTERGTHSVGLREWTEESYQVILLDENLNLLSSRELVPNAYTQAVGCRDGVCFVRLMGGPVFRSADGGRTWEPTDIAQVRECLQEEG